MMTVAGVQTISLTGNMRMLSPQPTRALWQDDYDDYQHMGLGLIPSPVNVLKRSMSCVETRSERYMWSSRGIAFQNEAFRLQTEAKIHEMIFTVDNRSSSSTNILLAEKALKYRKIRMRKQPQDNADDTKKTDESAEITM